MIEMRLGGNYKKDFHEKHSGTILVESEPFTSFRTMNEIARWTKENFQDDALMGLEKIKERDSSCYITWHCVSEIDATAAKLRWT